MYKDNRKGNGNNKNQRFHRQLLRLFMEGEFVCSDDWQAMREQAVRLAYRQEKKVSISAIKYEGTDEDPVIKEGQPIMQFSKHNDTVYIVGGID